MTKHGRVSFTTAPGKCRDEKHRKKSKPAKKKDSTPAPRAAPPPPQMNRSGRTRRAPDRYSMM